MTSSAVPPDGSVPSGPAVAPARGPVRAARLPLRRPTNGRWVAGVAAGVAAHLDLSVVLVRLLFVLLAPVSGVGVVLYVFWWVTVPVGDPAEAARAARPSVFARLARRAPGEPGRRRWPVTDIAVGALLVLAAAAIVAVHAGVDLGLQWVLPGLVLLAGVALAWSQLDEVQRGRWRESAGGGRTPVGLLRVLGGIVLAGVGLLLLVGQGTGRGVDGATLVQAVIAAVAMVVGVALVLAPWWLRLVRELGDERAARARESERADIAAHLHDSVLQTLALIRAHSDEPAEVARMARAQERELREWLYDDRPAPGTSLAAALRAVVAEVEDTRSGPGGDPVAIDTVVVGDRVPDADTAALLQATREALVNAVVHGRPPVSLYLEVGAERAEVFVRDRGDGFDVDAIAADRFGVRESIVGRVRRRGGTAKVTSSAERGTEVHLVVPLRGAGDAPITDEQTAGAARPADTRDERAEES